MLRRPAPMKARGRWLDRILVPACPETLLSGEGGRVAQDAEAILRLVGFEGPVWSRPHLPGPPSDLLASVFGIAVGFRCAASESRGWCSRGQSSRHRSPAIMICLSHGWPSLVCRGRQPSPVRVPVTLACRRDAVLRGQGGVPSRPSNAPVCGFQTASFSKSVWDPTHASPQARSTLASSPRLAGLDPQGRRVGRGVWAEVSGQAVGGEPQPVALCHCVPVPVPTQAAPSVATSASTGGVGRLSLRESRRNDAEGRAGSVGTRVEEEVRGGRKRRGSQSCEMRSGTFAH